MNPYKNLLIATGIIVLALTSQTQAQVSKSETQDAKAQLAQKKPVNDLRKAVISNKKVFTTNDFPNQFGNKNLVQGGADAGGGSSVALNGKRKLLDLAETDELNYFEPKDNYGAGYFITSGMTTLLTHTFSISCPELHNEMQGMTNERFIKIFMTAYGLDRLQAHGVGMQWCQYMVGAKFAYKKAGWDADLIILAKKSNLPPIKPLRWAYVDYDLETINDSGLIRVENPQTKKQVAIQKDGLVVINRIEFEKMDGESKTALFVHEAALYATKLLNPALIDSQGTAPVRAYVRSLVHYFKNWDYQKPDEKYPAEAVREAFAALGIPEQ